MAMLGSAFLRRRTRTALQAIAFSALAATLGGCYSATQDFAQIPDDYRARHPIALKDGVHTVEVFVGRNRGGLSPAQRADVLAFAHSWRREATSGIVIDVPQGGPVKLAAQDSLREIHSILNAAGVPGNGVRVRPYEQADFSLASIKISYSKLTAEAGPCGQWPYDLGPTNDSPFFSNKPYWNLGCASQRNLAAMVDNPADLVQPRGETPAYTNRRSVMMDKYRKGENPSGTYPPDASNSYDASRIGGLAK